MGYENVMVLLFFFAKLVQAISVPLSDDPSRVKCATVGGPIKLGQDQTTEQLECCPRDFYVADPEHPADKNGNLICVRDT